MLIDGKLTGTVGIKGEENETKLVYLSDELTKETHTITIRSKTKFNIDSVVLWE